MNSNQEFLRRVTFSWGVVGTVIIVLFVLFDVFGGWRWEPFNPIYDQMIVSIYFALGACLFWASRDPERHRSLLWFTVWSSYAHGAVMLFHPVTNDMHRGHLIGDVWILVGGTALLLALLRNPVRTQN